MIAEIGKIVTKYLGNSKKLTLKLNSGTHSVILN